MLDYIIIAVVALIAIKIFFKAAKFVITVAIFLAIAGFLLYYFNIDITIFSGLF